ncbi:MAG: DNA-binding NtrC family response regulator [Polaribacter sp.]|jgi:DNA-binding NtrC family response regulator
MKKREATILIIDDDEDILISAKLLLKRKYTDIITRNNPRGINRLISTQDIDLVFLDMNYRVGFNDGKEGMYLLQHLLEIKPEIVIVLMTAFGEVELAVNAIKMGAFDFILKPWTNEKILATVEAGLELSRSNQKLKLAKLKNKVGLTEDETNAGPVIGSSPLMQKIMQTIKKVSNTLADVLILGENGTGKQHLAKEIHQLSDRRNQPFIHVDLGALTESLFESELFGYKKGAFTGANEDKIGRFEMAQDGTIFLDEIGNLTLNLQSKLLTVLQDRKVSRLGEGIERPINARMIFATNASLVDKVKEGTFREDLLYRINTIEVEIPPLRKRPSDITEFVTFFLQSYQEKYKKPPLSISDEAIKVLKTHRWPGNIRELQHTIERGVLLTETEEINIADLNLSVAPSLQELVEPGGNMNLRDIELLLIQKALEKFKGNISKTAKELGLTRAALYRRMEKYNL